MARPEEVVFGGASNPPPERSYCLKSTANMPLIAHSGGGDDDDDDGDGGEDQTFANQSCFSVLYQEPC